MRKKRFKKFGPLLLKNALLLALMFSAATSEARVSRVLKFNGVPPAMANTIRKKFPYVFEREVTLGEIDEIVRYLMKSGHFSNVEAVERPVSPGSENRETVIVASTLKVVSGIRISGNKVLSQSEILKTLAIEKNQPFERKNLLASAEELRSTYESLGYHNAKVEIDFNLPKDGEVEVLIDIKEGLPVRVGTVVVDSSNSSLSGDIERLSRSLKGKVLTDDELLEFQKSVGEFLQKNRFLTARLSTPSVAFNPERTSAKLTYTIENPWKIDFQFSGNAFFVDGTLIRQLEIDRLAGASSSPAPDMAEKIRRLYQNAGFANVEVSFKESLNEKTHRLAIAFAIIENPRVRISKIEVTGNISRPSAYYAKFIKTTNGDILGSGFYNRKDIEESIANLITELQNQGYLRARMQSQRADYTPDKSKVKISLILDEGPLTQIRQIRFEGVDSFPKTLLANKLPIKAGAALGLRELESSLEIIKNFYHTEGFLEMKILNEGEQNKIVTYNETNTQATVEFQIYEGPRVVVGSIATHGNTFTKDYVITRELPFKQGDVLTPEKIDESVFRLQKLGIFSQVSVRTLEEGTNIAERTVIVEIVEGNPGVFVTRVGATNERKHLTLRGALGVAYRNLGGTGRGVSFRVDPKYSTDPAVSYVEHTIAASYLEPYIFGDRNRGRVNLVREQQFNGFTAENETIIRDTNSIGLLLERDLTRNIKLTFTAYNFSNDRYFERSSYRTVRTQNVGKTGPLLEFDYRDDAFNPTRGSYSSIAYEFADPLLGSSMDSDKTIKFSKVTAGHTRYVPLFGRRNLTWVTQLRGGYVNNLANRKGVPASEAFFLGGRSTIRGFDPGDENEKIPNIFELGQTDLTDFFVTNDSFFGLLKTELWFPIYGQIGGTIFYDGGAVYVNQPDVEIPDHYRDSVGAGLRVQTPVGPVNIEFGYKLDRQMVRRSRLGTGLKDERESAYAIHISIGAI